MSIKKLVAENIAFFGLCVTIILALCGFGAYENVQSREIEHNETVIVEQEKRIDRYETKMDKLLDKIDEQNNKIDNLRIEILKRR